MFKARNLCYTWDVKKPLKYGLLSLTVALWVPLSALANNAGGNGNVGVGLTGGNYSLNVGLGKNPSLNSLVQNIIIFLGQAILAVAGALFVAGAIMVTVSGVKEDYRQRGKEIMFGAIISIAVVLGAYAILRMLYYVLQ